MTRKLIAVGTILALAGCADTPTVYGLYRNTPYYPAAVAFAAGAGDTLAVIRNNPFPTDRDNSGVLAAMQGQNLGPRLHYTQTPRPNDTYGYRVVVAFGTPSTGVRDLCRNSEAAFGTAPDGRMAATAAFCLGRSMLTEVSAIGPGAGQPDDPRFKQLMSDMLVALFPIDNPDRGGNCIGASC
jgi:hypothetical protein